MIFDPGAPPLRSRPLLSLGSEDLSLILPHLTRIDLPQGMILADIDARVDHVYFPEAGMVSFVMITLAGQSVEAATIGREGVVNALCALGSGVSAVQSIMQIAGSGLRMDCARLLDAVAASAGIRRMVHRGAEGLTNQALQSVACMAFHSVSERLARWLLTARHQIGSDRINLTQEFLAQMLGCQRTTVTLVAHELQAAGLIRYKRGQVEILDAAALEEASCECYAQTRQRWEEIFPSPS